MALDPAIDVDPSWSGREVEIYCGPHAGRRALILGPCACHAYDARLPETGEIVTLYDGDFGLPREGSTQR